MPSFAARRYHRLAPMFLVLALLVVTATLLALAGPLTARATATADSVQVDEGQKLFAANCATCHGLSAEGGVVAPSLIGVGAAAVDFQVGTGRMPMQASGPQAEAKPRQFDDQETAQLAAFVASLGAGPSVPTESEVDGSLGDPAHGGELFRTNCAMCHGAVGGGGALSEGKFAPALWTTTPEHIFEAMITGPQSMPVFNDANISPEGKRDIIAYLEVQREGSPGGNALGALGPVSEGVWAWILGVGLIIGITVWIGAKSS